MGQLHPVAGSKLYIGAAMDLPTADLAETDFDSQTWTEIKGWTNMGPIGDTSASITSDWIGAKRTKKLKGTRDAGNMENTFDVLSDDPGQLALIAAEQSSSNFAFRVVLDDAPATGSAPTPSERLFVALVMSTSEQGGNANTPYAMQAALAINSNIVKVAASTGA